MRILYLLADFPFPLTKGTRVQTFNLLRYMARNNECHVLSFLEGPIDIGIENFKCMIQGVRILGLFKRKSGFKLQLARIKHLLRGNPMFLARWEDDAFVRAVVNAFRNTHYDLVHLEGIQLVPYISLCHTKPTILSTIDAISFVQSQTVEKYFLKKAYRKFAAWSTARFERKNLSKATKIHVVSQPDCLYLRSRIPSLDVENIEIGVPEELINYKFIDSGLMENKPPRILFSGLLSAEGIARGLQQFLSKAYPSILKVFPDVQMVVLGQNAPSAVRRRVESVPNVQYIAWARDYYAELAKSQVIIFPDLSGTGIKNRVIQAMALAKAIVGSPIVFEGIPIKDGIHCYVRTIDEGFSHAVIALLKDVRLREQIGASASQLVLNNYTMDVVGLKWLSLYNSVIDKFRKRGKYIGK
jgi:glycosyltransferase involved in cell wall biosynthesis